MATSEPAPSPLQKFESAMKQILSVSKTEIQRREAEYKKQRQVKKHAKHG